MKNQKGITLIALVIIVMAIGVILFAGAKYTKQYIQNQKNEDIKAEMLAIQSVATNISNKHDVDETNNILVGIKLDIENNTTEYNITDQLKEQLKNTENAEFYILNQDDLNNHNLKNITINNTQFYIVDYNSTEIFYSQGINGKYKLSEM